MIISASRRTDIPAFFAEWFMNRVREGYFFSTNPFNPGQRKRIGLRPEDAEIIVFWSKNPGPLLKYLRELDTLGHRYYFQYTLNGYPAVFEPRLPPLEQRLETFMLLSQKIGKEKVIWRYDPVIVSSVTPLGYHIDRIGYLAERLGPYTGRLTLSFLDFYGKVQSRLKKLEEEQGITIEDFLRSRSREEVLDFCRAIGEICGKQGMEVFSCAEAADLSAAGIKHGSCIDGELIRKLFGLEKSLLRDVNQRKECRCVRSVDMGVYNTCSFQCAYCYANYSEASIARNLDKHDPEGEDMLKKYRRV